MDRYLVLVVCVTVMVFCKSFHGFPWLDSCGIWRVVFSNHLWYCNTLFYYNHFYVAFKFDNPAIPLILHFYFDLEYCCDYRFSQFLLVLPEFPVFRGCFNCFNEVVPSSYCFGGCFLIEYLTVIDPIFKSDQFFLLYSVEYDLAINRIPASLIPEGRQWFFYLFIVKVSQSFCCAE